MTTSVEKIFQDRKVNYTPSGHDLLIRCLNPDHEDRNPSLRIDKVSGMGHCFSCGWKVNIFKHYGIIHNFQSSRVVQIKDKIRGIYAATRGLEMPEGYALFEREFRGISAHTLEAYEAFTHKDYEDRLVFPLRDNSGKIRAFIGRHMFSNAGKRYDIKPSGARIPFFPHNYEIINGTIVIVEGIFDALNLIDKGIPNTVSIMGLQTLNEKNYKEKLGAFKLRGVSKIIILFDGDTPGRKHAETLEPLIQSENIHTERIDLPDDIDPGSLSGDDIEQLKRIITDEQNRTNR